MPSKVKKFVMLICFSHVLIARNIIKTLDLGHLLHEHSKQIFHINCIKLTDSKVPLEPDYHSNNVDFLLNFKNKFLLFRWSNLKIAYPWSFYQITLIFFFNFLNQIFSGKNVLLNRIEHKCIYCEKDSFKRVRAVYAPKLTDFVMTC